VSGGKQLGLDAKHAPNIGKDKVSSPFWALMMTTTIRNSTRIGRGQKQIIEVTMMFKLTLSEIYDTPA